MNNNEEFITFILYINGIIFVALLVTCGSLFHILQNQPQSNTIHPLPWHTFATPHPPSSLLPRTSPTLSHHHQHSREQITLLQITLIESNDINRMGLDGDGVRVWLLCLRWQRRLELEGEG